MKKSEKRRIWREKRVYLLFWLYIGIISKLRENLLYFNPKVQQERFYGRKS